LGSIKRGRVKKGFPSIANMAYVEGMLKVIDQKLDYLMGIEEIDKSELEEIKKLLKEVEEGKIVPAEEVLE